MATRTDDIANAERAEALGRVLSSGSLVIDVGANRGQFARDVRGAADCRVVSFEPDAGAFADLAALAAEDPNVTAVQSVVSDETAEVDFYVSVSDIGSSLLRPVPGQSSEWATFSHIDRLPATRLDDYFRDAEIDYVDLLKTDCQGADARVLLSAGEYLTPDRIGALLVEMNFHAFYEGQDAATAPIDIAYEHGYFLAGFFRHYNREGWLWWGDALFLPNRPPFSTQ